jgi:hypothetical protein
VFYMRRDAVGWYIGRGRVLFECGLVVMVCTAVLSEGVGFFSGSALFLLGGSTAPLRGWKRERHLWRFATAIWVFLFLTGVGAIDLTVVWVRRVIDRQADIIDVLRLMDFIGMGLIVLLACRMVATIIRENRGL